MAIVKRDDSYSFVPWENRMVEKIGNIRFLVSFNAPSHDVVVAETKAKLEAEEKARASAKEAKAKAEVDVAKRAKGAAAAGAAAAAALTAAAVSMEVAKKAKLSADAAAEYYRLKEASEAGKEPVVIERNAPTKKIKTMGALATLPPRAKVEKPE